MANKLARGSTISAIHDGMELIFFKRLRIGKFETMVHKDKFVQTKATTSAAMKDAARMAGKLDYEVNGGAGKARQNVRKQKQVCNVGWRGEFRPK